MGILHALLESPVGGIMRRAYCAAAHAVDRFLQIRTEDDSIAELPANTPLVIETTRKSTHTDNHRNQAAAYWTIRLVFKRLDLRPDDVFVDIGCGFGRVVCMAARRPLRRVAGIELMDAYAEQARLNASSLRGRKAPVDIICDDASRADMCEGTVYYMFNPFGADTLEDFLDHLWASIRENPRPVRICYGSPRHEEVFAACGFLERYDEFLTLGGSRVTLWRLRELPARVQKSKTSQLHAASVPGLIAAAWGGGEFAANGGL